MIHIRGGSKGRGAVFNFGILLKFEFQIGNIRMIAKIRIKLTWANEITHFNWWNRWNLNFWKEISNLMFRDPYIIDNFWKMRTVLKKRTISHKETSYFSVLLMTTCTIWRSHDEECTFSSTCCCTFYAHLQWYSCTS